MSDGLGANYDQWRLAGPPDDEGCQDCPCEEVDDPRPVWQHENGEWLECTHKVACGCDGCECRCHYADEPDVDIDDDDFDYDAGR